MLPTVTTSEPTTTDEPADFIFDPEHHPRRLNLGCGFDIRPGYLNVDFQDFHSPDLVGDVRDLSMLPADTFEEIIAIDVLEHLPRSDSEKGITEWARLLQAGGSLELQMPDVVACGRFLGEHDDVTAHTQMLGQLFGTQGYTGDFHLAGFTDIILADVLRTAGFHRTVIGTRDGWMLTSVSELAGSAVLEPLSVGWLYGFWDLEGSGRTAWRWCDRRAELLVINHQDSPVRVRVSAGISRSPGDGADVLVTCRATGAEFQDVLAIPATGEKFWSRTMSIQPGPARIVFSTEADVLDVPDPRTMAFRLTDATVKLI